MPTNSGITLANHLRNIEVSIPLGGLRYDLPSDLIGQVYFPDCQNVHIEEGVIRERVGGTKISSDDVLTYLYYDVNDDTDIKLRDGANSNIKLAMSILTSGVARTANKLKLKLKRVGSVSGNLSVTIESDNAGSPSGTAITNGTSVNVDASTISTTAEWITFTFSTPFTLAASTTYWIVLQGTYTVSASDYIAWRLTANGGYSDGAAKEYDSSWGVVTGAAPDFLFKLYRDTTAIMHTKMFKKKDDTKYSMLATLDRLFVYDGTSFVDVSGYSASNLFTGTIDDKFTSDTYIYNETFLITNYVDNIKKYTGSGFCSNLGGSPPRAKVIKVLGAYVLLGYIYSEGSDRPQRIAWCNTNDIENWDAATSNAGERDLYGAKDAIVDIDILQDYICVILQRSIYLGYGVDTEDVFEFKRKIDGMGGMSTGLTINFRDSIGFMGWDNIYKFDGSAIINRIGDSVKDGIFNQSDATSSGRGSSVLVEEKGEWRFLTCKSGSDYPDLEWVFNYKYQSYFKNTRSQGISCVGLNDSDQSKTIDQLVGTIDEQAWRINDRILLAFSPLLWYGTVEGEVLQVDGMSWDDGDDLVDAYVTTKNFTFFNDQGQRIRGRIDEISFDAKGNSIDIEYSNDGGQTWFTYYSNITLLPGWKFYKRAKRLDVKELMLRFRNPRSGEGFWIKDFGIKLRAGGRIY